MPSQAQSQPRSIGVIGSGALGGYFGIRFANAGHHVRFLLREQSPLRSAQSFVLNLADGHALRIDNPDCCTDPAEFEAPDWLWVALKSTANDRLHALLPAAVGPHTRIVTVQNGLGNLEAIQAACPNNPVLAGLCQIGVNREADGQWLSFVPGDGFVQIGPQCEADAPHVEACADLLQSAEIKVRRTRSIGEALWRKLMWNVPFNGLTVACGGTPTSTVCKDPHLRAVARALMEELRLAANALGFSIEADYPDKLLGFTDALGDYLASSVLDFRNRRPLEIDAIWRNPLDSGRQQGIQMPHLATLTAILAALNPPNAPIK